MRQKIILVAAFLAIVFSFSACGSKKVDVRDYIESFITVSGADGYGKADMDSFDELELVDDIVNNCLTSKNTDPLTAKIDLYGDIDLELKQDYENLKNGDKIELTLTYDEAAFKAYGIRFKNKSGDVLEYEIHDLPELGSFDPFEDLDYTITGYNGYATIEVSNKSEDNIDSIYTSFYIEDEENKSLNTKSKLSNGDKLKVHPYSGYTTEEDYINYCIENLLSKPTRTEMEIEVKDLKDPKTIDLFGDEYLEISVSGISNSDIEGFYHNGKLTLKNKKDNKIYYHVRKDSYLSNGEKVTIYASTSSTYIFDSGNSEWEHEQLLNYCLKTYDAIPKSYSYTYTVEGLDYYATSIEQIPDETINLMKNAADDVRTEEVAQWKESSLNSSDYIGAYFMHPKEVENNSWGSTAHIWNGTQDNKIYLIFKNTVTDPDGEFSYYWYIAFTNVLIKNDGTADVDVSNYEIPTVYDNGHLKTSKYIYPGFEKYDDMYAKLVTSEADFYDCDSTVKE